MQARAALRIVAPGRPSREKVVSQAEARLQDDEAVFALPALRELVAAEKDVARLAGGACSGVVDIFKCVRKRRGHGRHQNATTAGTIQFQRRPTLQASETLNTTAAGKSTQIKVILTGTAIYLHEAALGGQLGKPWLKLDLSALNGTDLASIAQLAHSLQGNDFANQTQLLAVAKNVHVAGTQTINGVATTEYAGSVRAAQALKTLPASFRKAMAPELQVLGNGTISFHVWIDGQHHTRKITDVETVNGETINSTVLITAINQPVHITIPPASQTATPPGA